MPEPARCRAVSRSTRLHAGRLRPAATADRGLQPQARGPFKRFGDHDPRPALMVTGLILSYLLLHFAK